MKNVVTFTSQPATMVYGGHQRNAPNRAPLCRVCVKSVAIIPLVTVFILSFPFTLYADTSTSTSTVANASTSINLSTGTSNSLGSSPSGTVGANTGVKAGDGQNSPASVGTSTDPNTNISIGGSSATQSVGVTGNPTGAKVSTAASINNGPSTASSRTNGDGSSDLNISTGADNSSAGKAANSGISTASANLGQASISTGGQQGGADISTDSSFGPSVSRLDQERLQFQLALDALNNGALEVYRSLTELSRNYILYPYLVYYDLKNRLDSASDDEIMSFIDKYDDTPLSDRLRWQWLYNLGASQDWRKFLSVYNGERSTTLRCYNLTARMSLDPSAQTRRKVLTEAERLWMVGREQPDACDTVFKLLDSSSRITRQKIWARIRLAMHRGNVTLAKRLAKGLGRSDRSTVNLWASVYSNPEKGLKLRQIKKDTSIHREIVLQGIKRLARRDASRAHQLWRQLAHKYRFSRSERGKQSRTIALRSSYQREPKALEWLKALKPAYVDKHVRIWRVRTALQRQQWAEVVAAIEAMKPQEANDDQWRYWLARAKEQVGDSVGAKKIYTALAQDTNYYGFLAADRIGKPYSFNSQPITKDQQKIAALKASPQIKRARELYILGQVTDARREWNTAMDRFNDEKVMQAAVLAREWQWYDNAIFTVARTGRFDDLDLRFPTPFRDEVLRNAQAYDLDPWLIYGVARRESAFNTDAHSSAGALGLMQLMPATARFQSKLLGIDRPSRTDLLTSDTNLLLGSAYLNTMLQRYNGNQVLATAAYNAGPGRVDQYIPKSSKVSADVWVDTLPIKETRRYVRAVMAYSIIFNWKLTQKITPLKQRMAAIGENANNLSSL